MGTFAIPLSGLQASSDALSVISNNLANLNTDGYKDQSLTFGDVFANLQGTSGNGDPMQIGGGVLVQNTVSNFTNGGLDATGQPSNMALQGNGFFVVSNNGQLNYTRDGDFSVSPTGQLVDASGNLVMGYQANAAGQITAGGALAPITVNGTGTLAAKASATFSTTTNLQSDSPAKTTFTTPLAVTDSLGETQNLSITYTASATPNTWNYSISLPASALGTTGAPFPLTSGTMTFDSSGNLKSTTVTGGAGAVSVSGAGAGTPSAITGINIANLADGAAPMSLTWNLNSASGSPTITQQDQASASSTLNVDGFGAGTLKSFSVLSNGVVEGTFSNNQTLALGQVAVGNFANPEGLTQTNGGDFLATTASGAAVLGIAGAGGNGTITGGSVELSNVNLSDEFSNMIVAQQNYEANAKALTTLDQVSQATIQLIS
jgi:flagellar hook protein FlgE